jgi:hypothetical protein
MWVILHDPRTIFNHLEKNIVALVEEKDIVAYQEALCGTVGSKHVLDRESPHCQPFVSFQKDFQDYYARKYVPWDPTTTLQTDKTFQVAQREPEKSPVWRFRDAGQPSLYSIGR